MPYVRSYPEQLPVLRDLLPTIETPVQIIAGARDPVVPSVNAEYLHERLPRSKLDLIDALHFVGSASLSVLDRRVERQHSGS